MTHSVDPSPKGAEKELSRILDPEIFFHFLDLEIKRARRYQNFFSVLILKLIPLASRENGLGLQTCYKQLSYLVGEELRESDILGSLGEDMLVVVLPYADRTAAGRARSHFEGGLKYYDFKRVGYEVKIGQICFPMDGTDTKDLIQKVIGPAAN
jgi:GGDEF domain-containing protein